MGKEKNYRSLIKGITWRMIGTIDTIIISFTLTGKVKVALSIGGIEVFSKIILYFFHEKIWQRIKFGIIDNNNNKPQQ